MYYRRRGAKTLVSGTVVPVCSSGPPLFAGNHNCPVMTICNTNTCVRDRSEAIPHNRTMWKNERSAAGRLVFISPRAASRHELFILCEFGPTGMQRGHLGERATGTPATRHLRFAIATGEELPRLKIIWALTKMKKRTFKCNVNPAKHDTVVYNILT